MPDRVGAIGSFHGGGLATDGPDSPHLLIPQMKASALYAIAENDDQKDPEAKTKLREAYDAAGLPADERFYFVHSYGVLDWKLEPASPHMVPPLVTWSTHGAPFVAAVENGPLAATQFHPEKSGEAGIRLLANWITSLPAATL